MKKITNLELDTLIEGLTQYKEEGVIDPWVFADGRTVEPLDVLVELRKLRKSQKTAYLRHKP